MENSQRRHATKLTRLRQQDNMDSVDGSETPVATVFDPLVAKVIWGEARLPVSQPTKGTLLNALNDVGGEGEAPAGYTLLPGSYHAVDANGLDAAVYVNTNTGQVIFAFTGDNPFTNAGPMSADQPILVPRTDRANTTLADRLYVRGPSPTQLGSTTHTHQPR